MMIYMAPMEGITGYIYRNIYGRYFEGVDKYFTPFIAPAKGRPLRTRELKDILPENNRGLHVVPQILTNDADDFLKTAKFLKEYGYTEVNINLGCPSGTVVSKWKGSGLLYDIDRLDHFLYGVYEADIMKVSIKTRIGKLFPEEFEDIINIYKKYPISELIIHPRIQTDYYKNTPNMEVFNSGVCQYLSDRQNEMCCGSDRLYTASAASDSANKKWRIVHDEQEICYNGDLFDLDAYRRLKNKYAFLSKVMLGRGLIGNPFLPEMIKRCKLDDEDRRDICTKSDISGGEMSEVYITCDNPLLKRENANRFKEFHDELLSSYRSSDLGDNNTLFKMKELWLYMGGLFDENPDAGKYLKRIKKSKNMEEYKIAVNGLL